MTYLFAAYTVIWVIIFAYSLMLGKREKLLSDEVFMLKKSLESKGL